MLGIPGFEPRDTDPIWDGPFERIMPAGAMEIAREVFGLDALTVARLETERDDSFRIRTPMRDIVLKVAHPGDDPAAIDLQTKALLHAKSRDPALPLQSHLATPGGDLTPVLRDRDNRIARAFGWLPGTLLSNVVPNKAQLILLGESLGRMSVALRGFEHHGSAYPLAWDLAQAQNLRQLSEQNPIRAVAEALDRYESVVVPLLAELPQQVIHNDFNPGNIVVDAADPNYVTGIIDFGDTVRSIRVADLAVALSYQLYPLGRSWAECGSFIEGFERRTLLLDDEREVLKTLVITRFAQRILINDWMVAHGDARASARSHRGGILAGLEALLGGH